MAEIKRKIRKTFIETDVPMLTRVWLELRHRLDHLRANDVNLFEIRQVISSRTSALIEHKM